MTIKYPNFYCLPRHEVECFLLDSAIVWYRCALACNSRDLEAFCLDYIVFNMDTVMCSRHWRCLDLENLVTLLKRSDLIVHSEYAILRVRVFTRDSYCFQRILAIAILSVCLSVPRVDQSKMVQDRITKFSPSAARKTLVLGTVKLFHKFEGGHPELGR